MLKQPNPNTAERVSPARVFARSTGDAIWRGTKQEAALACLTGEASVKLLVGPPSSGKSKILQLYEAEAADRTVLACSGPQRTSLSVLSSLLMSSGAEIWTISESEQRTLLTAFIEQLSFHDKRVAICVDDVSDISDEAWTEIERLTHLKSAGGPLVDLIIAATRQDTSRPRLGRFLRESTTSQVEAMHFLAPPDSRDLESYIAWRLGRFGIPISFNSDACTAVARKSAGRFGLVNLICQVALWNRDLSQPCEIDEDQIYAAVEKLAALKNSDSCSSRRNPLRAGASSRPAADKNSNRLTVYLNNEKIRQLPLNTTLIFGRSQDCDIRLDSRLISRYHAIITVDSDGTYFVSDLGSTNGVLVNGKRIKCKPIADGDVIDLCEFRVRVELDTVLQTTPEQVQAGEDIDDDTATLWAPNIRTLGRTSGGVA